MSEWDLKNKIIAREKAKKGMKGKINAMCCSCVFDPQDNGTWRAQVEACNVKACPLYDVRPRSKSTI